MSLSRRTRLVQLGRQEKGSGTRPVNPPVMRASTVVFDSVSEWRAVRARRETQQVLSYGARGTATTFALEDALTELEHGYRCKLYPTGLAAAAGVLLAALRPGDHLLVTAAVYGPVRQLCSGMLTDLGIDCEFFPADGNDLGERVRHNTRLIYAEVPGSLLNQMCDLSAMVAHARRVGALVAVDNTWASGWLFNPLLQGADISILAVTKYIAGHSDVMMGAAVCNERAFSTVAKAADGMGLTSNPDEAALALRGLRTLDARLRLHQTHALQVAQFLEGRPEVAQVYYPALPSDSGHALWLRDFRGANGLLSLRFKSFNSAQRDDWVDQLSLFGVGASWGGFESLALPIEPPPDCTSTTGESVHTYVRLHIGLEDPVDLLSDLTQAFERIAPL